MSVEDTLAVECVRGLQAIRNRPDARRQVEEYLLRDGWLADADVVDLTDRHPARADAGVRSTS